MSRENVEIVRAWVAAINRGAIEDLLEIAHPDIEYRSYLASLSGAHGVYRGHDGLRRYFRELSEAWQWFHVDVDEYRDLGEKVVNAGRLQAKGRVSGLEVEEQLAWLHTFSAGTGPRRYLRHEAFSDLGEALTAADGHV